MKIWHNPRCAKSRETLALIRSSGYDVAVVEYLKHPPTKTELKSVLVKLSIEPEKLIRKSESIFKTHYKGKTMSDDDWLNAMVKYPKLIERPIVMTSNMAVIGRPPSEVLAIL